MTDKPRILRRVLIALATLLPVMVVTLQTENAEATGAAYAYSFGTEPYADTLAAAEVSARCGLTPMQLAALMVAPSYPETGASGMSAPSPLTMSRYDNQDALYSFASKTTAYPNAFWHPGLGVWAIDSAGYWDLTAAEAINTQTASRVVAEAMASRWCGYAGDPADEVARRTFTWSPWHGCNASRCEVIYNAIFDPAGLKVNLDPSVKRTGGMQQRSCRLSDGSVVRCDFVDVSLTQGYKGFTIPAFGPSPITKPYYVVRIGDKEERWWLKEDSGYGATISAKKLVRANARTMTPSPALTWSAGDGLCDLTVQKGACGVTSGPQPVDARFHEMTPTRVIDSRADSKVGPFATPWGSGETRNVQLAGAAGIPSGASAVVLNVTAVNPSASTHVTLWPTGQGVPATSNLNIPTGDTRANLVTVGLPSTGNVSIRNNSGATHMVVDVVGWYGVGSSGGRYNSVTPSRLLDTRMSGGMVAATATTKLSVVGVAGIPSGATAVALNLTGVKPTKATHLTVWPTGVTKPTASNLNVPAGDVRANTVVAKVGSDGTVSIYNNAGKVDLVVDVVGWFGSSGAAFTPLSPARLWDSRGGPGPAGRVGAMGVRDVQVAGVGDVPANATKAIVNMTAVNPDASTYLTVWPKGVSRPATSNLNVGKGDTRANLAIVDIGSGGKVSVYNNAGTTDVVVDVVGWFR